MPILVDKVGSEGEAGVYTGNKDFYPVNPLAQPLPWWSKLYKRIELLPWSLRYNIGVTEEAILKDKIIRLATSIRFQDKWTSNVIKHAISEFSKRMGSDYYGYHNIDHELEATYLTLLAICGHSQQNIFTQDDFIYLFVAALFHDYDLRKLYDKPHEESVEEFLRSDDKIKNSLLVLG